MGRAWRAGTVVVGLGLGLGLPGAAARAQDGLGGPPPAPRPAAGRERSLVFTAPPGWRAVEAVAPERWAWVAGEAREGAPAPLRVAALRVARRTLDAHVARWARQFEGPDGQPLAADAARREALEGEGVPATLVEVRGTFVGALEPGDEDAPRREGWAALHALLEGPDGPWVVVVRGPAAAVEAVRAQVAALVKAARPGEVEVPVEPPEEPAPAPEPDGE